MVPAPVLFAEAPGDTAQVELRDSNLFASRGTLTDAVATQSQGHAHCSGGGDVPRATGSLLKDPRKVRKSVVEGHVSSPTDPLQSPVKQQLMEMLNDAVAGQTSANLR